MRMKIEDRKLIPADCPNCGKTFKNVYSMSAHKGHCTRPNSTAHLDGKRGWAKGKVLKPLDEVFCVESKVGNDYVRRAIDNLQLKEYKCEGCGIDSWQGQSLTLDLDHINGVSNDHRLENLRFLCPNCHSQTETFRGKNIGNKGKKKVSDDELRAALGKHSSIRQALIEVGLAPKGGNYSRCYALLSD